MENRQLIRAQMIQTDRYTYRESFRLTQKDKFKPNMIKEFCSKFKLANRRIVKKTQIRKKFRPHSHRRKKNVRTRSYDFM